MSNYRLIWFQHFHKAAGTTIVDMALKNGESLYLPNTNGNPLDENGKYLPIWRIEKRSLKNFVDKCEEVGCTFVSPEWGVADLETLRKDERVTVVTSIREPYSRFLSNYIFDYCHGFTHEQNIRNYVGSKRSFSHFNYYCHMLSRKKEGEYQVTKSDFIKAQTRLLYFDYIGIVGSHNWLENFCKSVNWMPFETKLNSKKNHWIKIVRNLLGGRPRVARRIFESTKLNIDSSFKKDFLMANGFDCELFKNAEKLGKEGFSNAVEVFAN
jgi:hypothetical protein